MSQSKRAFLFPADDSDRSEAAFSWMLKTVYQDGDEIHIVHVVPRIKFQAAGYAVPSLNAPMNIDREAYDEVIHKAEEFIVRRFLSKFPQESHSTPIVHIIKSETDSASKGHIICEKAADLQSTMVCMGNHNRGAVAEFFMGSVSQYVVHHCKRPVLIVRGE
ncbi:hypothetical protein DUNSADRAFT_10458 [Dunaliella salina]|uniref:UspA domain-containing protein n=1 Tax=Dunaliella salina TaxID=3046 RepID=A0ABQ7GFB2_DUNSA|nr:hypothetical protein DUNSADRAFT_10458 [Dunaliella salina]|eukprot:KAF5833293.1 hypothetical protein DUNSADRAFT_10458 [Dunaliella salina]